MENSKTKREARERGRGVLCNRWRRRQSADWSAKMVAVLRWLRGELKLAALLTMAALLKMAVLTMVVVLKMATKSADPRSEAARSSVVSLIDTVRLEEEGDRGVSGVKVSFFFFSFLSFLLFLLDFFSFFETKEEKEEHVKMDLGFRNLWWRFFLWKKGDLVNEEKKGRDFTLIPK